MTGETDLEWLVYTVRTQRIVGTPEAAQALTQAGTLERFSLGERLIREGDTDRSIFFILTGRVSVSVKGNRIAERDRGECVGEMALLDGSAKRSADVIALEDVAALRVEQAAFISIANQHPDLWRRVGAAVAERLRQRGHFLRPANPVPVLFVGSSSEALPLAQQVAAALPADIETRLWSEDIFTAGRFALQSLARQAQEADFAALLFTPDDSLRMRGKALPAPRGNVIFELGLFMGTLGADRSYLVAPANVELHIPSDLLGLTRITYPFRRSGWRRILPSVANWHLASASDVSLAARAISQDVSARIKDLGVRC